jgi:hypothetical protein
MPLILRKPTVCVTTALVLVISYLLTRNSSDLWATKIGKKEEKGKGKKENGQRVVS